MDEYSQYRSLNSLSLQSKIFALRHLLPLRPAQAP